MRTRHARANPGLELIETERLTLARPLPADVKELFEISSDPRVWTHYPSLRPADSGRTRKSVKRWIQGWNEHGLDTWVVRLRGSSAVVGYGGCSVQLDVWNVGYRFAASVHGRGYATELAQTGVLRARQLEPERPIIARMVEHNVASRRVAEKLGLTLAYRAFDSGNPDPSAVRLVYADRTLTAAQLARLVSEP
jgi:RimJ/RimL family protein N-acetyltransferase